MAPSYSGHPAQAPPGARASTSSDRSTAASAASFNPVPLQTAKVVVARALVCSPALTEREYFFKAGDLFRHSALKLFIGALEERPHDRMGQTPAEQCVGVRRPGWLQSDRIAPRGYRQLREGFQDRPFVLLDRDFGLLGELIEVVRFQLAVQLVFLDEARPIGDNEALEHVLQGIGIQ